MGLRTFAEFKSDVAIALGKIELITSKDADLGRWVNYGYQDLCSSVDFEALDADASIDTVDTQAFIATPADALAVKVVRNVTDNTVLGYLPKSEFYRRSVSSGVPIYWTRHGANIRLIPTPNATVKSLLVIYKVAPTPLTGVNVTVLPSIWDPVVFMLGVQYALLSLGDEQRAAAWHARAGLYIATRMTEGDLQGFERGVGASIPLSMKQMIELQAGGGGQ